MMKTSVVIPAYNGWEYLQANLPAVLKLGASEVIVVDDASTDNTQQLIKEKFPQIKLLRHDRNARFPISVNDGFDLASGEVVVLINQDVNPDKNLVKNCLVHFKDPKVFAVTFNEQDKSWAQGGFVKGFLQYTNGIKDSQIHESLWASGGSAAFRKKTWEELGGFDPVFSPGYSEDHDLGLRAKAAGYMILWDPKCKVRHVRETTFNKTFPAKKLRYIKERNYLLVHWKNLTGWRLLEHVVALVMRIVAHPGYIVPTLWALVKLPQVIWKKLVS